MDIIWCIYLFLLYIAVDCGTLTNPGNGRVSDTGGTTYGQTLPTVVRQATDWWEAVLALV